MDYSLVQEDTYSFSNEDIATKRTKGIQINRANRSCCTYTIKQIKEAHIKDDDATFIIDNKEAMDVILIGIVRSITKHDTYIAYIIEDGTGVIETRLWGIGAGDENTIMPDMYVRVHGRLHSFNNKLGNVPSSKVVAIKDHNEITYHLLNCIHTHLVNGKGDHVTGFMDRLYSGSDNSNVSVVKRAINECSNGKAGAYIHSVVVQLKERMAEHQIMEIIDELLDEGKLYSTKDDQHFALAQYI